MLASFIINLKISAVNLQYKDNAGMIKLIIENKSDTILNLIIL